MKVALISPKWNQMVNSYPSLGLGYLAAVLERRGDEVRIFDFGLDPRRPLEEEVYDVLAFRPDVIGLTAMTTSYHSAEEIMTLLRAGTRAPMVLGGPHATVFPERTLQEQPALDYLVFGEGEETMLELMEVIEGRRDPAAVAGLCYRRDGEVICNPARPLIRDLDALPFPARHLFQLERYPLYAPDGGRMLTVLTSRGCPYNCSYCFKGIVGRTYRQRSPENLILELKELIRTYGIRNFYFIDDLFTLDVKRLNVLLDMIIAEGLDIRWQCLARVDRVTPELLRKMAAAGCRQIHYGIESGNQKILDRVGKRITLEQVRQAVRWTAEAGIRSKGYFMLGLPGEEEEDVDALIGLVQRTAGQFPHQIVVNVTPYVPKPHTPFQWLSAPAVDVVKGRLERVRQGLRGKRVQVRAESPEWSQVQAVLARGDERLAPALVGMRRPTLAAWRQSLEEQGLKPAEWLRAWSYEEALPWDHIDHGVSRRFLQRMAERAEEGKMPAGCPGAGCAACGVCKEAEAGES
ncbi:MAG: B12-binding domain-containing radical SAM protein [Anaerolineae bacterium]